MSMLNKSVIICDVFPKSTRKKGPLGSKKSQKHTKKKTFYESPLKHIQLSTKRWEQIQKQKKLLNDTKQANKKKQNFLSVTDAGFHDTVIILSDNESESNNHDEQSNYKNNTKSRKRPLENLSEDRQIVHNNLCSSNKSPKSREDEIETCTKKKQKMNCSALSDNNSSCLLISDTEDSIIPTVSIDNENIAPSKSMSQGSDDIVVVWSSGEPSLPENQSGEIKNHEKDPNHEKDDRLFMIDCIPNPANLIYLKSNETIKSKKCDRDIETKDQMKDSELLFSKPGLKLPKARDISRTIMIEKRKSILNTLANLEQKTLDSYRKRSELPSTSKSVNVSSTSVNVSSTSVNISSTSVNVSSTSVNVSSTSVNISSTSQTTSEPSNKLREIIIDGNNVAMAHKKGKGFSEEGLKLVIDYFKQRGHTVKVFVPQYRRALTNPLLEKWYAEGTVIFTPSRYIEGKWITSHDDRYILQYATVSKGIVISSDQYRDLYQENPEWRDTIVNRLLSPTFVGDYVMFPEDPLGREGPTLNKFLRH